MSHASTRVSCFVYAFFVMAAGLASLMLAQMVFATEQSPGKSLRTDRGTQASKGISAFSVSLCGALSQNTLLTASNSPYIVTCDVTVNSGITLTIDPGVTLMFATNTRLSISGRLVAVGTIGDKVIFTSNQGSPAAGAWKGLYFAATSSANILENVSIQYAGARYSLTHTDPSLISNPGSNYYTWSSIYVDGGSVDMTGSTITNGKGVGVNSYQGTLSVAGTTINGILSGTEAVGSYTYAYAGHGVYSYGSGLSITGSTLSSNGRRGVHVHGGGTRPKLANNTFTNNGDYAVYIYQNYPTTDSTDNSATGNIPNGLGIVSTVGTNTTWPLVGIPVIVDDLTVNMTTTLTIPAGQVFKVSSGSQYSLARINIRGTLVVQGTTANPVLVTSLKDDTYGGDTNGDGNASLPAAGDWQGLYFATSSTGNTLDNVVIKYGGQASRLTHTDPSLISNPGSNYYTWSSIYVDGGSVAITNTLIYGAKGAGVNIYQGVASMSNSTVSNTQLGTELIGSYTYAYAGHGVYSYGSGLSIAGSTLSANGRRGVHVHGGSTRPLLAGNTFTSNGDYAAYIYQNYPTSASIGNSATDNALNGMGVVSTVGTNTTWPLVGIPVIVDDLTVNMTTTLTVPAGQVFKVSSGSQYSPARINIRGTLVVQGTTANPVVFTSLKDDSYGGDTNHNGSGNSPDPGDWQGLYFASTSGGNTLDNVVIKYGGQASRLTHTDPSLISNPGSNYYTWSSIYIDGGSVAIAESLVSNGKGIGVNTYQGTSSITNTIVQVIQLGTQSIGSYTYAYAGHGVYSYGSGLSIAGSTLSANGRRGVHVHGGSTRPALVSNTFTDNGDFAAYIYQNYPTSASIGNSAASNVVNGLGIVSTVGVSTNWPLLGMPVIVDDLTVNQATTLTVPAGQVFKVSSGSQYSPARINIRGTLVVQVTTGNQVVFTSLKDDSYGGDTNGDGNASLPAAGDWQGLYFASTSGGNTLDNVVIKYGGQASRLTHTDPSLISNPGSNYYTWSSIYIDGGSVVIANTLIFNSKGVGVNSYQGTLSVAGTTVNGILSGTQSIGSYTYAYAGHGVYSYGSGLSITGSTLSSNGRRGVHAHGGSVRPTLAANTFTGNGDYAAYIYQNYPTSASIGNSATGNALNGMGVVSTVGTNTTWPLVGIPVIVDDLTVNMTTTLTVPAGQVFKVSSGSQYSPARINIRGTLAVQGTSTNPVVFTSLKDDSYGGDTNHNGSNSTPMPGDWQGMYLAPSSNGSILDNVVIKYGGQASRLTHTDPSLISNPGSNYYTWSSIYVDGGSVAISNSMISDGKGVGINVYQAVATITNNAITGMQSGSEVIGSYTFSYASYGVYSYGQQTVAENNWWGSDSGPSPYGTGSKINYQSCYDSARKVYVICSYKVDAEPWLGQREFQGMQLGSSGPAAAYQARMSDPVNTANGNYIYNRTDLAIAGRGLGLDFVRSYNSLVPTSGPLGWGWTHNWNIGLTQEASSQSVLVQFGDGHLEKWTRSGASYTGAPGVQGTLVKNGDDSFDLVSKDRVSYHFSAAGALNWVEDRNNNRTTLAYDAQGRLSTVTDPTSRSLTLAYTSPVSTTLISQVSDPSGRTIGFSYNITGELISAVDTTGAATNMSYDASHRMLTLTDAMSHAVIRNVYDINGRVIEQYDAYNSKTTFAYDEPSHKTLTTDPRNNTTIHQYDGLWRLISETDPLTKTTYFSYDEADNRTRIVDRRGYTTTIVYDSSANPVRITDTLGFTSTLEYDTDSNLTSATDARGYTTLYQYDANGNLTQSTDALGNITTHAYNDFGQLTDSTDPLGRATLYSYDALGYATVITNALGQQIARVYDTAGRKLSETDELSRTNAYGYDPANRLIVMTDALGLATHYAYDMVGNRTATQDTAGRATLFGYDAKDRLAVVTDTLGTATRYAYDSNNNRTSITDPLGRITRYSYDALNRTISITDPLTRTTGYGYDANGNRTSVTDASNRTTISVYDAGNRLASVTDAAGNQTTYTYDPNGNRLSTVDAKGHVTSYTYSALNRLASITDPLGNTTTYTYDTVGNLTGKALPNGQSLTSIYDTLNRLTSKSAPGVSIEYAYDAVGNRLAMTDTTGVTQYSYDALDRPIQVTDPGGVTVGYGYDTAGNRTSLEYPGARAVTYAYDGLNRMTNVTDWDSRVVTYTYDVASQLLATSNPNGTSTMYTYDLAGQTRAITSTSVVSGTFATFQYTYDNVANRLSEVAGDGTVTFSYDPVYRLAGATYPGGEQVSYAYDPVGNRAAMTSTLVGATSYTYDNADRQLTAGGASFLWDANGRMSSRSVGSLSTGYTFDPLDRMTGVTTGSDTLMFSYNGDGARIEKVSNGVSTSYLQDGAASLPVVLAETTGGQETLYVYGLGLITQVQPSGSRVYYHTDALGSVRALSDGDGRTLTRYRYDAFGAIRSQTGGAGNSFLFAGEQVDSETALVFLRARYYDPGTGRFLSSDPLSAAPVPPAQVSKFLYVANNPANFTDPSGKILFLPAIALGITVVSYIEWGVEWAHLISAGKTAFDSSLKYADSLNTAAGTPAGSMAYQNEVLRAYQLKHETVAPARGVLKASMDVAVGAPCTSISLGTGCGVFDPNDTGGHIAEIIEFTWNKLFMTVKDADSFTFGRTESFGKPPSSEK